MKRSFSLAAGIVLATALALVATSAAGAGPPITVKAVCTVGPIRCRAVLRTDIPIVKQAQAAHDGFGPADLPRRLQPSRPSRCRGGPGARRSGIVDAYDDPTIESDLATSTLSYYGLPPCTTANGCFREGQPGRRAGQLPVSRTRTERRGAGARRRDGLGDLPEVPHSPRRGELGRRGGGLCLNPAQQERPRLRPWTPPSNLGATVTSNSYGTVGPEPNQTLLGPLLRPSRALRSWPSSGDYAYGYDLAGGLPVRDRSRWHDADPRRRRGAGTDRGPHSRSLRRRARAPGSARGRDVRGTRCDSRWPRRGRAGSYRADRAP